MFLFKTTSESFRVIEDPRAHVILKPCVKFAAERGIRSYYSRYSFGLKCPLFAPSLMTWYDITV